MTDVIRIKVYGMPASKGSKKFVGMIRSKTDGRQIPHMVDDDRKLGPWKRAVEKSARAVYIGAPLDGPLAARMIFTLPKPKSAPRRRRTWPDKLPDLDKICRSTFDALKTAGVIKDDSRIVELDRAAKVFPGEDPEALDAPGVLIEIRLLTDAATPELFQQLEHVA